MLSCDSHVIYIYAFGFFSTAVGLRCKDGVVFAVEKIITSKLHEPASSKRIFTIDRHVGIVRLLLFVIYYLLL